MANKTCGECRYHKNNRCMLPCYTISHPAEYSACHHFEVKTPPTNGDVIRQMSNDELAGVIECPHFEGMCIHRDDEYPCKCCKRAWLNAPADCVKQNGNHDSRQYTKRGETMNIPPCVSCEDYGTLKCPLFNVELPLKSCHKSMESEVNNG